MRSARWLLVLLLLALPLAAGAVAWNDCGTFGAATDMSPYAFLPRTTYCADTAATDASAVLNVSACDHFFAYLDPDMDGTGAGCEGDLWTCASSTYSANSCTKLSPIIAGVTQDVTLDGVTLERRGVDWRTATWVAWVPTSNAGSKKCRLMLSCR